jgi:ADP-heptose:LPS heptosyltransferase
MFPKGYSSQVMYHQCLQDYDMDSTPDTLLIVSNAEKRLAWSILKEIDIDSNFIVMVPGAAWTQKQWQAEKYNNVINELSRLKNKKIIMLGTKNDKICKDISLINDSVVDYSGKTDLRKAMAIISLSDSVFGSDTGLLHMAEALGKHVSMILGPTSTETGGGVSLKESINIETDIWCRPCSQNGKQKCYRTRQYCMELISTDMVTNSVIERA